ncbi:hypothetical protein [Promicromonospora sp. NFX87]|uniref:hypothetical protein n=1 Tax=Promicromonospora sp. NFX87 TaxID=3402691 RepID=UPI003AFABF3C
MSASAPAAGLVSWLLAARVTRAANREAPSAERLAGSSCAMSRAKRACQTFLAATRRGYDFSKNHEEKCSGMRYGDIYPEDRARDKLVEDALADLGLEVPDDVYAVDVQLRDVLHTHVWKWDSTTKEAAHATDEGVEAAEVSLRRAVRDRLSNG